MSIPVGCRRCAECGVVKPLQHFAHKPTTGHRGICTTCEPPVPDAKRERMCASKVRYRSQSIALGVAQRAARRTEFMRVYECPLCKGWHLTHKPALSKGKP